MFYHNPGNRYANNQPRCRYYIGCQYSNISEFGRYVILLRVQVLRSRTRKGWRWEIRNAKICILHSTWNKCSFGSIHFCGMLRKRRAEWVFVEPWVVRICLVVPFDRNLWVLVRGDYSVDIVVRYNTTKRRTFLELQISTRLHEGVLSGRICHLLLHHVY